LAASSLPLCSGLEKSGKSVLLTTSATVFIELIRERM
jgi:hypothetical protein